MAAHGKLRRERGPHAEYETQVKEIRWQLSEQLRCLELQGDLRRELLLELAEFMRRRAEVELEYSRGLDKLAERFSGKGGRLGSGSREHQSFRKEPSLLSPLHCWAVLLQQTRQQSRESAALSEVLTGPLAQRLTHLSEYVGRIVRKGKDLEQQLQEELLKVVSELQTVRTGQGPPSLYMAPGQAQGELGATSRGDLGQSTSSPWASGPGSGHRGSGKVLSESQTGSVRGWLWLWPSAVAALPWSSFQVRKTYQVYRTESVNAETKLREAERQEEKRAGRSAAAATTISASEAGPSRKSSIKKGGRLVEKRQAKFLEHKLKCTKARNEYLLSLASVNAAISNYYVQDVLDLMDCCDTGFYLALGQVLRSYTAAESRTQASQMQGLGSLEEALEALDPPGDKAKVLRLHAAAFCPPLRFDYQPHEGDEVAEIQVEMELRDEILPRAQNIQSRLGRQTIETEEVNKTLKATLQALLELVASDDGDVLESLQASPSTESLKSTGSDPGARQAGRRRGQQQETETFYITKLQEYLSGRSVLAKLQAKHERLQEAIQRGDKEEREMSWAQYSQRKVQRSRHPRPSSQYNQKLFGGDMEKFIQSSGQPVPLVVESCIRFINLNGLQHEGIFRVSGAQPRVSEIRDAFERGEDPLVEGCGAQDLDSVAGVLKLYFRSLEPPLFPPDLFSELLASMELEEAAERVEPVSRLLDQLPGPVLVVLRYLFTFLNHLAQYSDENMMDPYNLAVCFGPTLLPVPAGQDPVALQGRVNRLVQTLILQPVSVFPTLAELPGPVYEKCMAPPSASCLGDAQLDSMAGENEPELEAGALAQDDDLEGVVEAVACFAYTGRTAQELSFQRGDILRLHTRASSDWWRGELAGTRGLIPHKYITLPAAGAEKHLVGQGPQVTGESSQEGLPVECTSRPELSSPLETTGTSGHRRHCLIPASPERQVEVDKGVTQTMDSVFKELLGKAAARQGLGPVSPSSPGSSRPCKNKGFPRGPGAPASP
ncbi:rho GTPase-activating protein 4 isoform X2 [Elephas maximus indicus]|uniref:rho GTPase-activating protein 4 isoform X2 n=1 Tax=Elephas maximus indicus TaxID=99487 RepID=UPI0021170147|nr:rho GTPase-activating protein 4 isoform X2 [Elephas maximus indicus]